MEEDSFESRKGKNMARIGEDASGGGRVRWGILGTGRIATKFAAELKRVERLGGSSVAQAVAARELERSERFAGEHQIPHACGSYTELLERPDIDVVYIGLVNSQHYPVCKEALLAGKAVLCEKPFTMHPSQSDELIGLARQRGLFLMEGLWSRCFPVVRAVRDIIHGKEYGAVTLAEFDFGFIGDLSPQGRLMNPALGGGALNDVGIYPLTLSQFFLGPIVEFQAMATLSPSGVDLRVLVNARHESGALSRLAASIDTITQKEGNLFAERAAIHIPSPLWKPPLAICRIHEGQRGSTPARPPTERRIEGAYGGNGFEFEINHVAECVAAGLTESPLMPLEETLQTALLMEKIRKECGIAAPGL